MVSVTATVQWRTRVKVSFSRTVSWRTRKALQRNSPVKWQARTRVTSSPAAVAWRAQLKSAVLSGGTYGSGTYGSGTYGGGSVPVLNWNARGSVRLVSRAGWVTRRMVPVSVNASISWRTHGTVKLADRISWRVLVPTLVSVRASSSWRVRYRPSRNAMVNWNTAGHAMKPAVPLAWRTRVHLVALNGGTYGMGSYGSGPYGGVIPAVSWNARGSVRLVSRAVWRIRQPLRATQSEAVTYRVRTRAASSAAVAWRTRVSAGLGGAYGSGAYGSGTYGGGLPGAAWQARTKVSVSKQVSWRSRQRVSHASAVTWDAHGPVVAQVTASVRWNTRDQVTANSFSSRMFSPRTGGSSPGIAWNSRVKVVKSAACSYKVHKLVRVLAPVAWGDVGVIRVAQGIEWASRTPVAVTATMEWYVGQSVPTYIRMAGRVPWASAQ